MVANNFMLGKMNRVMDLERHPGGKGINIAMMLGIMGVEVIATGFLGRESSHFFQEELHRHNVTTNFVHINEPTRHNYFIIDDNTKTLTLIDEQGPIIAPNELRFFIKNFQRLLGRIKFVIIAGSLPPNVDCSIYCELLEMANSSRVKTVINTQEENLLKCLEKKPFISMPDTRSSEFLFGKKLDESLDRKQAACKILEQASGTSIVSIDNKSFIISTPKGCWEAIAPDVDVRSYLKSSDAIIAGMIYSLYQNPDIMESIRWGTALSAATSTYRCRSIKSKEEVEKFLDQVTIREV